MPEDAHTMPQVISDLTGTWTLDPRRTTIQFQTKTMWILSVKSTLRVTEGSGIVDGNGHVTGRLVLEPRSIDTKNKKRDDTFKATTSSTSRNIRPSSLT